MIIDYLEKVNRELQDEKDNLEIKLSEVRLVMRENVKFLQILEESKDNTEAFSPRNMNRSENERIEELQAEQKSLLESEQCLKLSINTLDSKIAESQSVLKVAKEQQETSDKLLTKNVSNMDFFKMKILETQESERQRIARELHDSSVQSMTSLVHKTELCSKLTNIDPIRCKLELLNMSKTIKEVIEEMRGMIYNLRPMSFDDIGFDVTVERELAKIQNDGIVNTSYSVEGENVTLKPVVGLTLLRIIQEACNNALKHADATMISVKIIYKKHKIKAIIKDDGKGFDTEKEGGIKEDNSGFGLSTMRERIYLLSGKIDISSKLDCGTTITIEIPINKEEN